MGSAFIYFTETNNISDISLFTRDQNRILYLIPIHFLWFYNDLAKISEETWFSSRSTYFTFSKTHRNIESGFTCLKKKNTYFVFFKVFICLASFFTVKWQGTRKCHFFFFYSKPFDIFLLE